MSLLSHRALAELVALQAAVRELAHKRNAALHVLRASRNVAAPDAQERYWLEFSWRDQNYRLAVRKLAQFCAGRAVLVPGNERSLANTKNERFGLVRL